MPDTHVRHLVFAKATGTGTQTVTGIGFRGTAAIFWSTKQTATGLAAGIRWTHGVTDGTLQVCKEAGWPDASSSPGGNQAESHSTILDFRAIGGTSVVASATFTGFTADGFTLNWTTNDGSADLIHVLVISCSNASLVTIPTTGTTPGDTQNVSVGFQPDSIIWIQGETTDGLPYAINRNIVSATMPSLSQPSAGANSQARVFLAALDGPGTEGNLTQFVRVPMAFSIFYGFVNEALRVSALTSDGFTITTDGSFGVTNHTHYALCLGGITCKVGTVDLNGGGDKTVTTGFRPHAVLMHLADPAFQPASLCVGAWDDVGSQGVSTIAAAVSSGVTVAVRGETSGSIVRAISPTAGGTGTDVSVAAISSVTDTEFILSVSLYGGGFPTAAYLAFGEIATSERNLLTGTNHGVQGDDNLIVGAGGDVTGDTNALFNLSTTPYALVASRTFKVIADDIQFSTGTDTLAPIYRSTFVLNNTQIKALPSGAATILAAPGAGKRWAMRGASILCDASAGAYTNISPVAWARIDLGGIQISTLIVNDPQMYDGNGAQLTRLLAASKNIGAMIPLTLVDDDGWWGLSYIDTAGATLINAAMTLHVDNAGLGNFTGGNAANTLTLVLDYTRIP